MHLSEDKTSCPGQLGHGLSLLQPKQIRTLHLERGRETDLLIVFPRGRTRGPLYLFPLLDLEERRVVEVEVVVEENGPRTSGGWERGEIDGGEGVKGVEVVDIERRRSEKRGESGN